VKIRAVTLGLDLPAPPVDAAPFTAAASFLNRARSTFADVGIDVQTMRVAGPDLTSLLGSMDAARLAGWARETEDAARNAGVQYLSFGRLPSSADSIVKEQVAAILAAGEIGFFSADLIAQKVPSVAMAAACACAVSDLARSTPRGFGNLRFAATANCPANIPFLPAAYHGGGLPRFAIAVQAADVVVDAFADAGGLSDLEDRLVQRLEQATEPVERIAEQLSGSSGYPFVGIDLSPAPFPSDDVSIGAAIEAAGVDRFGAPGTLYVAAMITRAIRRTRTRRSGFSGLMLPVLEDSVLARRAAERPSSLHELLLYSAVCGTGLDTIPLPADISEAELAGAYLDVAALSVALGKPLTARLLPIPDAAVGEMTTFTFDYFSNTRVPPAVGGGASGVLERGQ
jgi:hypothetical protein